MFTGIVETMGTISEIITTPHYTMTITDASPVLTDVHLGDSIAIQGVCLTVTSFTQTKTSFQIQIAPETLRKTNLGSLKPGDKVNLERAMNALSRFGGHMVQGHVDCTVSLINVTPDPPDSVLYTFRVPDAKDSFGVDYLPLIVSKGYVCLDGVSLTVVDVDRLTRSFRVMLIPYTRAHVTIPFREIGHGVNLEVDPIGKYVESVVEKLLEDEGSGVSKRILEVVERVVKSKQEN